MAVSNIIKTIARHEFTHLVRDGRLRAAAWLGLGLLAAMALISWQTYRLELHERQHFERTAREQWEDQGEKQLHRAAHFGFYVTKPELPLALFDSGIKPATGQVLLLEAHERSAFTHSPVEDAGATAILGLSNSAEVMQLLGSLFVVLLAYGSIAREREDGTLRLLLAQGVSPQRWFAGKMLGLALAFTQLAAPVAIGLLILCTAANPAGFTADVAWRAAALIAVHMLYFATWLMGAVAVSAWVKSARGALALLLALWVAGGVLAPRLATTLASAAAPLPSAAAFRAAQSKDFSDGFENEPGWDTRLAELEKRTLAQYGVKSLDSLPVGFSGIRMQAMNTFSAMISDRHQQALEIIYTHQTRWQLVASVLGPFVPMRAFSQGMAGMDWAHYQHFAETGEIYRRGVVDSLDKMLESGMRGTGWELHAGREVWSKVPPFRYSWPTVAWALQQSWLPLALLLGWFALTVFAAWTALQRLRP